MEQAALAFEAVINEDPDAGDSWAGLGLCMAQLGQSEAAIACQRQVVRTGRKPV